MGDALYLSIYKDLLRDIKDGRYSGGIRLPTEKELAQKYFVSRITTKRALEMLANEGVIIRYPGKGSYVKNGNKLSRFETACSGDGNFIALVMGGYSSSFGLDIVNGAVDEAERRNLHLILKATYNCQKKEAEIISRLMDAKVAGIIVQPSRGQLYSPVILRAVYDGYPIVMIDRNMKGIAAPFVGVDNRFLSKVAVTKLMERGHEKIALLALGDENSSTIAERMEGFADACQEGLLWADRNLWLTGLDYRLQEQGLTAEDSGAYEFYVASIAEHLRLHPEITAVFGTEYRVSKAAWEAIRRIGKRVPEDVSLVSFDMDSSYIGTHKMSYVSQPQLLMGARSVQIIHGMLQNEPRETNHFLIPGEWVEGDSICGWAIAEKEQTQLKRYTFLAVFFCLILADLHLKTGSVMDYCGKKGIISECSKKYTFPDRIWMSGQKPRPFPLWVQAGR